MGGDDWRQWYRQQLRDGCGVETEAQAQTGSVLPSFSQQALQGTLRQQAPRPRREKHGREGRGMELTRKNGKRTG